jgi:23S rRNA-/tRNA-specific pseudouridylate synthase
MGVANACSHIQLLDVKGTGWLFSLQPVTGKTCQLRLHMSGPGFRIINVRIYPKLQPNETMSSTGLGSFWPSKSGSLIRSRDKSEGFSRSGDYYGDA